MRAMAILALSLVSIADAAVPPLVLYDDALRSGFNGNGTWAQAGDYSLTNTSPTDAASADSIQFVARGWGGLLFIANNTEFNLADYQNVTFRINGGSAGGQKLQMYVCDNYNSLLSSSVALSSIVAGGTIPRNAWATATLDFDAAQLTFGTFNCLVIMDADGQNDTANGQPPVYIDNIVFTPRTGGAASGATVNVSVDLTANVHPFSPLIFGVAYGDSARNAQMGYTVDRWGGNSTTRYNWQVDVHSTAGDYFWENIPGASDRTQVPPLNNDADAFISAALGSGIQPLMSIPTIGWTPRADSPLDHPFLVGFAVSKYGTQVPFPYQNDAVDPYDTNAGSGECDPASNASPNCVQYDSSGHHHLVNNDPHDTSTAVDQTFAAGWVAHMRTAHGTAANGGVQFFTLDNEVMLWNSTHRDVHPNPTTYDEIWTKTQLYAAAIKQQEPDALVTGPVTWGYCDLFGSAADNCVDGNDRQAHGGLPFVAWYLQQVCANPLPGGKHLVDYLDLHYYPQADPSGSAGFIYSNNDDAHTRDRRLRSLRELYDPTWASESWIGTLGDDPTWHYTKPDLIPRVKAWINQYCPGTKLAITEYAWDQDKTPDGAVAQAEALAIFAREGVDLATRWTAPDANTLAERGFQIFLNYNGAGAKVQGNSVAAASANVDQIGAYAFHGNGRSYVLLTNKDTVTHDVALSFDTAHYANWTLYGFTGSSALAQTNAGSMNGANLTLSALPPISASLLVLPDIDDIFKDGFGN